MKSTIQMAVIALVLFSASAGMSLWLNQSGKATETPTTAADGKAGKSDDKHTGDKHGTEKSGDKHAADKHAPDKSIEKTAHKSESTPVADPSVVLALREREARIERRQAQMDLVLRDLQTQREAHDALAKLVAAEVKTAAAKASDNSVKLVELEKKQADLDAIEQKNIEKMAAMYDTMAPESAARIIQQLADSGKLELAVKILGRMKERQAARVLAEIPDTTLAAQMLDKLRLLKRPAKSTSTP